MSTQTQIDILREQLADTALAANAELLEQHREIARLQAQVDALADALKAIQNRTRSGGSFLMGRDVDVIAATALTAVGR